MSRGFVGVASVRPGHLKSHFEVFLGDEWVVFRCEPDPFFSWAQLGSGVSVQAWVRSPLRYPLLYLSEEQRPSVSWV